MVEEIALHLGVHKTASTHLQQLIWKNNPLLAKYGVRFYRPVEMRKTVTPNIRRVLLNKNDKSKVDLQKAISEITSQDNFKRAILADENFIGDTQGIYKQGAIYPDALKRLKVIQEFIEPEKTKQIFICLRDYSEYIPSAYCEYIRHSDFVEFDTYIDKFEYSIDHWLKIVSEIMEIFPLSDICIWEYRKYREIEEKIVNYIVGEDVYKQFQRLERKIVRSSQSHKAISVMNTLQTVLTGAEIRNISHKIEEEYSKEKGYDRFDPYSVIEKEYLKEKTDREIDEIRKIDRVIYIG